MTSLFAYAVAVGVTAAAVITGAAVSTRTDSRLLGWIAGIGAFVLLVYLFITRTGLDRFLGTTVSGP